MTFKWPSKTDQFFFFFFEKEDFLKNGYGYDFETFTNRFLAKNCIRISYQLKTTFFQSNTKICKGCSLYYINVVSVIEEGNWLHLRDDIHEVPENGYDAIICMGNSFAHLPDFHGDQREHKLAIENFYSLIKPGGILLIDHRNYDHILDHGFAPHKNLYYNVIVISF